MVFGEKQDWKELLGKESQETLAEIFDIVQKHRIAYAAADDVKVAQLWSALIEFKNELKEVKEALTRVEEPLKTMIAVGDAEKRRVLEKIVSEMFRPKEEDREIIKRLAESLMKY